jgi:hypothetical protein
MQIPPKAYRADGHVALRLLICRDEELVDKCIW